MSARFGPASPRTRETWLAVAVLVVAAWVAYRPSFAVPFYFDDVAAITHNASIRDLTRLGTVLLPPADGGGMTGRPVVNLSLAFNYALGGTDPRGYHAFNLGVHLAAALLLFGLVRRTLALPSLRPRFGPAATGLAFGTALLWTVHPLQTESVTCVIQRTELLGSFFLLAALYAFVRGVTTTEPRRWEIAALSACALGMASKETMVAAPLFLLLYDRTFVAGSFAGAWQDRRQLHLAFAATWLVLLALLVQMGGSRGAAAGFGLGVPWWAYALKQCEAIPTYLRLVFWPHPLVLDYGTDVVTDPRSVLGGALLLVALVAATVWALVRRPALGFLGFGFFAWLAPSSSIVPLVAQTMAEHRMHLPLAFVLLAALLPLAPWPNRLRATLVAVLAGAATVATIARNRLLQDEVAVWAATAAQRPENPRAHASLGLALNERGRPAEAIPAFQRALALRPGSPDTELNLGNAHFRLRQWDEAAAAYARALAARPHFAPAHNGLGLVRAEKGDAAGALAAYAAALQADPVHAAAFQNRARLRFALARYPEAAADYAAAARLLPESYDAHYNLGLALAKAGDLRGAKPAFDTALRLRGDAAAYRAYAAFLMQQGDPAAALAALETALRLRPDFPEALRERDRLRPGAK
ncbi:MAG: hypothetical protein B9S34_11120 [Opitutia bacterium Tous-C1TDCM]|nr:MAG: hypothetical protein B9S34_11120 [Opitutae bacterium Tous-C1TDCM]